MLFESEDSDIARKFAKRLTNIGSSFANARQATVELWRDSLESMSVLHDPNTDDLMTDQEDWAAKPRMTFALASLVTLLTDVKDLAVVLHLRGKQCAESNAAKQEEKICKLHEILIRHSSPDKDLWKLCRENPRDKCDPRKDWSGNIMTKARRALVSAIIAKPQEMYSLLLDVDDIFQKLSKRRFSNNFPKIMKYKNGYP